MAFVVLKPDAKGAVTEQQIIEWCRGEMAVYKAPRRISFVDALPKTARYSKMVRRGAGVRHPAERSLLGGGRECLPREGRGLLRKKLRTLI